MFLIRLYGSRPYSNRICLFHVSRVVFQSSKVHQVIDSSNLWNFCINVSQYTPLFFLSFSECRKRTTIRFEIGTNCDSTSSTLGHMQTCPFIDWNSLSQVSGMNECAPCAPRIPCAACLAPAGSNIWRAQAGCTPPRAQSRIDQRLCL